MADLDFGGQCQKCLHFATGRHPDIGYKGAGCFHSASQSKGGNLVLTLPSIRAFEKGRNGQPNCFFLFGTIFGPSELFWAILDKNDFSPQKDKVGFGRGTFEQNINFSLKWSKWVQTVKNS